MKKCKAIVFLMMVLLSVESFCQSSGQVEMADVLRQDGKIYTVVAALVLILTATIILLVRVDKKIAKLEKQEQGSSKQKQ